MSPCRSIPLQQDRERLSAPDSTNGPGLVETHEEHCTVCHNPYICQYTTHLRRCAIEISNVTRHRAYLYHPKGVSSRRMLGASSAAPCPPTFQWRLPGVAQSWSHRALVADRVVAAALQALVAETGHPRRAHDVGAGRSPSHRLRTNRRAPTPGRCVRVVRGAPRLRPVWHLTDSSPIVTQPRPPSSPHWW